MRADVEAGPHRARPVQARQRLPAVDRRRLRAPRPRPRRGPERAEEHLGDAPDGKPGAASSTPSSARSPANGTRDWDEAKLEPWKEVVRQLMRHHRDDPDSSLADLHRVHPVPGLRRRRQVLDLRAQRRLRALDPRDLGGIRRRRSTRLLCSKR